MVTEEQTRSIVAMYAGLEILENMASDPAVTFSKNEGHAMDMAREALEEKFHAEIGNAIGDLKADFIEEIDDAIHSIMDNMCLKYGKRPSDYHLISEQREALYEEEDELATFIAHLLLNRIC